MVILFIEIGKVEVRISFKGENGYFIVSILSGFRFMESEMRSKVWIIDMYWGVVGIYVIFKVMGMNEIIR